MNKKGFTLAELLIVVVILGTLGAVAMPQFYPQKEKAVVAEAVAVLLTIRQGELGFKLTNGVYLPVAEGAAVTDWSKLGMENPNDDDNNTATTPATLFRFKYKTVGTTDADAYAYATRINTTETKYLNKVIKLKIRTGLWEDDATNPHPRRPSN